MTDQIWSVLNHDHGLIPTHPYLEFRVDPIAPLIKAFRAVFPDRSDIFFRTRRKKNFQQQRYFSIRNQPPEITCKTPARCDYHFGKTPVIKTSKRFLADRCTASRSVFRTADCRKRLSVDAEDSQHHVTLFSGCHFDKDRLRREWRSGKQSCLQETLISVTIT